MRVIKQENGITVNAIAGTSVVFFGLNLASQYRKNFRGFAIKRFDPADGETVWLRGVKTFEATEPHPVTGETFSTLRHPIQGFQWSDYSAKPGSEYTYKIACMYGDPAGLGSPRSIPVTVNTEWRKSLVGLRRYFLDFDSVGVPFFDRFLEKLFRQQKILVGLFIT